MNGQDRIPFSFSFSISFLLFVFIIIILICSPNVCASSQLAAQPRSFLDLDLDLVLAQMDEIVCKLWIVLVREKEQHLNLNLIPTLLYLFNACSARSSNFENDTHFHEMANSARFQVLKPELA